MSDDTFGFGEAKKPRPKGEPVLDLTGKLAAVRPSQPRGDPSTEAIDKIAERRGFRSREPAANPEAHRQIPAAQVPITSPAVMTRRRKGETGPFVAINTRAPVRVADPFIAWCEENRFSYWRGIEELMRRAGILPG